MRILFCIALLFAAVPSVQAELVYDVFYRAAGVDGIGSAVLNVAPDETIRGVEVILRETATNSETSPLGTGGLRGYAIELQSSTPGSFENGAYNSSFQFPATGNDGDTFSAFNFAGGTAGVEVAANTVELSLGTVDLIGPTLGNQIQFSLADFSPSVDNFVLANNVALDDVINFGNTLTLASITAIPEPSSFALIGTLGSVVLLRRRRR
ncbi:PEP-CTERM sorting domain-containing protein [Stieleria sp. JC731]|uniref:PEP-CTERM sorting domain-containing protein n=1 Tax=Pirellulaceae TaxID=2691357 RepID=UPI001E4E74B6|nr:PEP-CTERM sorting domain-containing protein [Stieleria sp. JC731]MCC9599429.1 PEP-CTERM sorting domain-containing protein [Stieleria sp. JC731]